MGEMLRSPAPAGAQAPRRSVQQDSSNGSEFKATHPGAQELRFHPLADIFPLIEGAEFDELVADIKRNGLKLPIILYKNKILDGRNRYRACKAAGIEIQSWDWSGYSGNDPAAYVISANIHRRHLTAEQKRELIAELLKADPSKSDRQIAKTVKASPTFVGKVRAEKEAAGDVSTVDTRRDTKGRQQPAKKAERKRKALERRVAERAAKRKRQVEALCKYYEIEETETKTEAERLAAGLIGADRGLARALHGFLLQCGADAIDLMDALGHLLGSEGNGADAEASAEKRREEFAKLDVSLRAPGAERPIEAAPSSGYLDPGPIPECLRRDRGQP